MSKGRVLVIDDSPIVRKMAEVALEEEGYEVFSAEDGEEGLKVTREVTPSVILVDFIMPKLSGYQFCQAIQEDEMLKDIPVILITGKGEDVGKKFLEKFGVIDYFIKPFKSADLVAKVNSITQLQETMFQEEEQGAVVSLTAEPPVIDFSEIVSDIKAFEPSLSVPDLPKAEPQITMHCDTTETEKISVAPLKVAAEKEKIQMDTTQAADIEKTVERITKKFLREEFQFSFQKSIADVLKQTGVIKSTDIILSGNLSNFTITDIFHLLAAKELSVKLSVFSDTFSADVYFDKNSIVCASLRRQGMEIIPEKSISNMPGTTGNSDESIKESVKISIFDTLCKIMELESGSFSFETYSQADSVSQDTDVRVNIYESLIEASRTVSDKVFSGMFDDSTMSIKIVRDIDLKDYNLNRNELITCACVNGERTLRDIADITSIEKIALKRLFYVLHNAGIIKIVKRRR